LKPIYGLLTIQVKKKRTSVSSIKLSELNMESYNYVKYTFGKNMAQFYKQCDLQTKNARKIVDETKIQLKYLSLNENSSPNFFLFPIKSNDRNKIIEIFYLNGIECGGHFNNSIKWSEQFGYLKGLCPNAEKMVEEIITIPCNYRVSKHKIKLIIETINKNKSLINENFN
jgi:dTDP-4-amino-4,6-dideoxygalactose transaminase